MVRSFRPVALAFAVSALIASGASAAEDTGAAADRSEVSKLPSRTFEQNVVAQAPTADVKKYGPDVLVAAAGWGVSPKEATHQLALQDAMDTIDYAALDAGFAEIRSTPGPSFEVNYYSRSGGTPDVRAAIAGAGLGRVTSFHQVPFTIGELEAAHAAFQAQHPELRADTMLDPVEGRLIVTVPELPDQPVAVAGDQGSVGVPIVWNEGSLSTPTLGGGQGMAPECTAGFTVKRPSDNVPGIATAGHCANNLTYLGWGISYAAGAVHSNYDVQWHTHGAVNWEPTFFDGSGVGSQIRVVQFRKQRPDMNVGDAVCKYGKWTGYTCGNITSKSVCPDWVAGCNPTFILVRKTGGGTMTWNGDSGGPVFFNNGAWGFVSGRRDYAGGQDLIFMPQQFVDVLGVQVMIG